MWVQTDQLHSTSNLRKPVSESMNQLTLSETRYIPFIIGIQLTQTQWELYENTGLQNCLNTNVLYD